MRIREKISLIVIVSILITAIPTAILITAFAKEKILSREVKNLLTMTDSQVDVASERLRAGEQKLKALSRLLQEALQKPVTQQEIDAFYQQVTLNEDGIWRNRRDDYDGNREAGIFLPDSPTLTEREKVLNLRIKQVMDTFGAAANRLHENVWYLSQDRSEVIFDKTFPEFVFEQDADNDYTQTPWVTLTSPESNPARLYRFTPPLFDPVPKVWMVSAVYPLYFNEHWMGALGEDMQLTNVLGFIFRDQQMYPDTQHFLLDKEGEFILAGQWQEALEAATNQDDFALNGEDELKALLNTHSLDYASVLLSRNLMIDGEEYIALGMRIAPVDWSYFRLVPVANIVEPLQQLLLMLFVMVFVITAVCGGLITAAIHTNVVSRLTRLTRAIRSYESGDRNVVALKVKGKDEIAMAAREFDVMAERVADARQALAESEERWNLALEGAGDGVWDWNISTGDVLYSKQWARMLGFKEHEISPEISSWDGLVHPDDIGKAREQLDNYLSGKTAVFAAEFRMQCKDGRWKWILSRGIVVERDREQCPTRMIGMHTDISYLKQIETDLRTLTKQQHELLEYSPIATRIAADGGRKVIYANRGYAELIKRDADTVLGADPADYYVDKAQYQQYLETLEQDGKVSDVLTRLRIPDGEEKVVLATYLPIQYENEKCVIGWFYDVTEWLKAQEALRLHASVFDNAWEGILITDKDNRIITVNHAFSEITGYGQDELIGEDPGVLASGRQDKSFYDKMWKTIHETGRWRGEIWNRRKNGEFYAEILTISAIKDEQGEITNYLGLFADITEIKNTERQLEDLAHYDSLTQLANRTLLSDRLEQSLNHARRRGSMLAVCFLDLDDFKPINDSFGHDVGDKLLIEVANRLNQVVRSGDTVARMGGDEFVLLITNIEDLQELDPVLTRINKKIAEEILLDSHIVSVTASIGVAIYPLDDVDADTLIRHADLSMYEAKQAGRDGYHIFDVKLDQQMHALHARIEQVAAALRNDELCLYYQPKVNMRTREVTGMEALIRWRHPEKGVLGAGEFLPAIESHELIITVGDWVLEQALQQIQQWRSQGLDLQVSVNVSARQIQHIDFVDKLEKLLSSYPDIPPALLELELLETSALETRQTAGVVEAAGQRLGIFFALDDFGTGYSSLTYLRKLPVRTLKIDRSFVSSMHESEGDMAIVKGVIELAQTFKRHIVAEGVETEAECDTLMQFGCETIQGYYIAKPMPAADVFDWVQSFQQSR